MTGEGFTLKEIVLQVLDAVKTIEGKLDGKASTTEVAELRTRVVALETKETERAAVSTANTATFTRREKIFALVAMFAAVAIQPLLHIRWGHL